MPALNWPAGLKAPARVAAKPIEMRADISAALRPL
jgi:hypothetical protein